MLKAYNNLFNYILLIVVTPTFGFFYSVFKLKDKTNILISSYFFILIYGFTFISNNDGFDSVAYLDIMYQISDNINRFGVVESFSNSVLIYNDFFVYTLIYIVAYIYPNPHFLFLVLSALFGLVYISFVNLILKYDFKFSWTNIIVFISILMVVFIHEINIIRFWLSSILIVYISIILAQNNKLKPRHYFLLVLTPIIHWSSLLYIGAVIFYLLLKKYNNIFFISFVFTLLIRLFFKDYFLNEISQFFSVYDTKAEIYYKSTVNGYASDKFVNVITSRFLYIFNIINAIVILFYYKFKNDLFYSNRNLYSLMLVFLSLGNMTLLISSGDRFIRVSIILFLSFLLISNKRNVQLIKRMLLVVLIPFILIQLRAFSFTFSLELLLTPLFMFFNNTEISIRSLT